MRNYIEIRGDHHKIENDQFISTWRVDQRLIVKAVTVEKLAGALFTPRSWRWAASGPRASGYSRSTTVNSG